MDQTEIHLPAVKDPTHWSTWMCKRGCNPHGKPTMEQVLAEPMDPWTEEPRLAGRTCVPMESPGWSHGEHSDS